MNIKNKFVTIIIILFFLFIGGASAFAEKAVPGDFLYSIKTSVNEPIAEIFAFSKEEKTEWQERLVERRLEEAQNLILKDRLNEINRINIEDKIKNQIEKSSVSINELALQNNEPTESSNINIRLHASLRAYQSVLEQLSLDANIGTNTRQETVKLISILNNEQNKVKNSPNDLELSAIKDSITALDLLNSIKLSYQKEKINLSINIQNKIDKKLALAETALQEGKTFLVSLNYINATDKFKIAINLTNETKLLMLSNVIRHNIEKNIGTHEKNTSDDIEEDDDVTKNDIDD